ncbi:MAG: hypothetical protein IKM27_01900 [Clostridia bacterium]|nr:hypothetical protein [Clostridia bacterium]
MKYVNASEILPKDLLNRIKCYAAGRLLYIPTDSEKKAWGENTGARAGYSARNNAIKAGFSKGAAVETLADEYFLTPETIKKIVYAKEKKMNDKQFPDIMFDYRITPKDAPVPQIRLNRHPVYDVAFEAGATAHYAAYDYPSGAISDIAEVTVVGEAEIHGEKGIRIECVWNKGEEEYEYRFAVVAGIDGDLCKPLAAETAENGITKLNTFLEGDTFFEIWGYETPLLIKENGKIHKLGDSITFAEDGATSDAVGKYTVEMNGKEYDTVLVVNVSSLDQGILTEEYLDAQGNSVLYRRFERGTNRRVPNEPCFKEYLPDSERVFVNGEEFVLWTDTINENVC